MFSLESSGLRRVRLLRIWGNTKLMRSLKGSPLFRNRHRKSWQRGRKMDQRQGGDSRTEFWR